MNMDTCTLVTTVVRQVPVFCLFYVFVCVRSCMRAQKLNPRLLKKITLTKNKTHKKKHPWRVGHGQGLPLQEYTRTTRVRRLNGLNRRGQLQWRAL